MTEQQEIFQLAVEHCSSGMIIYDGDGRVVLVNPEMERLFGYARDELLGRAVDMLMPGCLALAGEGAHRVSEPERVGVRKDGIQFPIEAHFKAASAQGGPFRLGIVLDISERRNNERLKEEFVSTVSHELRTPLTSIAGSLGLLAGGATGSMPEPTMRLLRIAHKNSERLVRLINDLLDIQKMKSGKVVFDLKRVEVHALIEQAIEANRGYAESFKVCVMLDPRSQAAFVRADPDRLVQVVTNLLSNACKFSPPDGEVLVSIACAQDCIRIAVRDHGPGIPESFRARIFEKFAQADIADARRKGGTGLGLSIVKQIVTLLGGAVGFADADGGGAVFQVDLPRWELADGAVEPAAASATAVLICDDDASVGGAIAARLQQAGFTPDISLTAADALTKAETSEYRAILVDLKLPDRDGISLIQDLRAQRRHQNTPIVVISADAARRRDDMRSSSLDVLDWLDKPIDIRHLVEVLERPLARNGGQRPNVLHVDDDASVREVVARAVGDSYVVTSVATIEEAQRALAARHFDLAVLDLMLSQASELDLLPALRGRDGNALPVILYSARAANGANAEQVQAALIKAPQSIDNLIVTLRKHLTVGQPSGRQPKEVA